jgi:hypothetical protein
MRSLWWVFHGEKKRDALMCPAGLTTLTSMTLIAAGTTSTGGLTALAMKKLRATLGAKNTPKQFPSQET